MNEPVKKQWAVAHLSDDFYLIETYSGYGRSGLDPSGKQHLLPPTIEAEKLGVALLDALAHSRFLSLDEIDDFFDYEKNKLLYAAWIDALMKRFGYKSKRALFNTMAYCSITVIDDTLEIVPMFHEKLEMWTGAQDMGVENLSISANSSPKEVGEALMLAFSRCI